jgi:excisionase family DNA binding protein
MKALQGVAGAAGLLGVSIWTVRAYERQKKLKAVRIGRRILFEESELERFVAERRRVQDAECQDMCARNNEVTHDNA